MSDGCPECGQILRGKRWGNPNCTGIFHDAPVVRPSVCPTCGSAYVMERCPPCWANDAVADPWHSCPSCKSTDPKVCRWVWLYGGASSHRHGLYQSCCPDPFHVVPPEGEK